MPVAGGAGADPAVIIPNLHWRYTGVTATNRMVAPRLAQLLPTAWLGPDAPAGFERIGFGDLVRLRRGPLRIWHARRNNEMIVGLKLRALGWPLRLVFTSAAQREHSSFSRALIARMDAVIATSPASAAFLKRESTVIQHGVDAALYQPAEDRAAELRAAGLDPDTQLIGCFGRVRAQKGTDLFVEAMCRLLPRFPGFAAVIIGPVTPDQRGFARELEERVAAAGLTERIRFLGALPSAELPAWFRRVLIYAFTSRVEGFGLTLLEAMASGAALVAARAGAAELLIENGMTGLLVPPGDAAALADALELMMGDPDTAAAVGRRARERVVAQFSVEHEAEQIADVYRQVLGDRLSGGSA